MSISDIKEQVKRQLTEYFDQMSSGEFEGVGIYPDDSLELVSLYLSVSADYDSQEIMREFGLSQPSELAEKFELATDIIGKDNKLAIGVIGLAHEFDIPPEHLVF